ncbi:MAG: pyridoxal phosphate-dependent aminotransferase [Candidatus Sulfotelmatobacter sp.]
MFSDRTNWRLAQNRFTVALEEVRARGARLFDLTVSNPTRAGLRYDERAILSALASPRALDYDPQSKGLLAAREAVAGYYQSEHGIRDLDAEQIVLTTSTSEGYSFVFRLLCNAGDELLVPKPSYPLFEFLADLQDVRLVPYPLIYDHGWQMDFPSLEKAVTERTRGVVVVHPNNPTGSYVKAGEVGMLNSFCREHGLAVIVDEVFLDYSLEPSGAKALAQEERNRSAGNVAPPKSDTADVKSLTNTRSLHAPSDRHSPTRRLGRDDNGVEHASFAGNREVLTFTLSGLSKVAALPQMKVAWLVTSGPQELAAAAIERLEVIADTYLSMNAPVQWAVPALLRQREDIQRQLLERVRANLAELDRQLAGQKACERLDVEGGWYAVLRVPVTRSDEELAIELLREKAVVVHPGHFFDFPSDGYLVLSLITPGGEFGVGVAAILEKLYS